MQYLFLFFSLWANIYLHTFKEKTRLIALIDMSKSREILIYVSELNNRIYFLFRHVFFRIMGIRPVFTNDKEAFINCTTPKLNYSVNRFADELYIKPQGLLYEKGIKRIPIKIEHYKNLPVFFMTDEQSDFPFDIFSAIFYLLSRYEEYLRYSPDRYGRFQPKESIAFHHNFLDEPIVERWVDLFKDFLKPRFTDFNYAQHTFQYIPTIDIDIAFAYRHRGILLGTILFISDLLERTCLKFFRQIESRFQIIFRSI